MICALVVISARSTRPRTALIRARLDTIALTARDIQRNSRVRLGLTTLTLCSNPLAAAFLVHPDRIAVLLVHRRQQASAVVDIIARAVRQPLNQPTQHWEVGAQLATIVRLGRRRPQPAVREHIVPPHIWQVHLETAPRDTTAHLGQTHQHRRIPPVQPATSVLKGPQALSRVLRVHSQRQRVWATRRNAPCVLQEATAQTLVKQQ